MVAVDLRKTEWPNRMRTFIDEVRGRSVLSVHAERPGGATRHVKADIAGLLSDSASNLAADIRLRLRQCLPAACSTVIHFEDPASIVLAEEARALLHGEPALIPASRFNYEPFESVGPVVVICSVIGAGRGLSALSQLLRNRAADGVVYLVGVARMEREEQVEHLSSNLALGSRHLVQVVRRASLPNDTHDPWRDEGQFWAAQSSTPSTRLDEIGSRREALMAGEAGLTDQLFLSDVQGRGLALRRSFVLWSGDTSSGTQADIYVTLSALLHLLRGRAFGEEGSLMQHPLLPKVIAPRTFQRFNDGVLQASIVRAARPAELDYAPAPTLSREMADFLAGTFRHAREESGEATPEFLFALLTGKLKLAMEHLSIALAPLSEGDAWPSGIAQEMRELLLATLPEQG